jgi:hypothetical protein
MKHDVHLISVRSMPTLSFSWDEASGEIDGQDAQFAREMVQGAVGVGYVPIEPHPNSHPIKSARLSRVDLAAIFGQWYVLPDWLEKVRPVGTAGPRRRRDSVEPTY